MLYSIITIIMSKQLDLKEARKLTVTLEKSHPDTYFRSLVFYFNSHGKNDVANFIKNPTSGVEVELDAETNVFIQNLLLLTSGEFNKHLDDECAITSLKNIMKKTDYIIDPDQFWKRSRFMLKYAGEYNVDEYINKVETIRMWSKRSDLGISDDALKSLVVSNLHGKMSTLRDILQTIHKGNKLEDVMEIISDYWYANKARLLNEDRPKFGQNPNFQRNNGKPRFQNFNQTRNDYQTSANNQSGSNGSNGEKSIGNINIEGEDMNNARTI